tara:strand:- start:182 stop:649 length:468 start_codon:yes stop_codon:yes gene_type:complete
LRSIELDLNFDKQKLLNIYDNYKYKIKTYTNKAGDDQPIGILSFDEKPQYIQFLENKFNFLHNSYYLISSGYHPHIDDTRQCIVSFEIQNHHNIPLKFYEPEEEVYHNGPIMWNTAVLHGSDPSPTERIFYQVELKDNNTFDYYVEQYKNNKLLK